MTVLSIIGGIFLAAWLLAVTYNNGTGRDTTDSPNRRSGLIIITDHATGVQYVAAPFIGMTPRIDANGKPYRD